METRSYRAAPGAYLVFAGISLALEVLWLGAAWKNGVVTWAPVLLIAGLYAATVVWLTRFRLPLAATAHTEIELKAQLRKTIIHELGHYFGFSEEELEERGWA